MFQKHPEFGHKNLIVNVVCFRCPTNKLQNRVDIAYTRTMAKRQKRLNDEIHSELCNTFIERKILNRHFH